MRPNILASVRHASKGASTRCARSALTNPKIGSRGASGEGGWDDRRGYRQPGCNSSARCRQILSRSNLTFRQWWAASDFATTLGQAWLDNRRQAPAARSKHFCSCSHDQTDINRYQHQHPGLVAAGGFPSASNGRTGKRERPGTATAGRPFPTAGRLASAASQYALEAVHRRLHPAPTVGTSTPEAITGTPTSWNPGTNNTLIQRLASQRRPRTRRYRRLPGIELPTSGDN